MNYYVQQRKSHFLPYIHTLIQDNIKRSKCTESDQLEELDLAR